MKHAIAAALVSLTLTTFSATALAADPMTHPKMMGHPMMHGKMIQGKMVAYCAECKMYYSASDAKKMHMKDGMGHKMAMMPLAKVPAGAKMAKGGDMMHGKM